MNSRKSFITFLSIAGVVIVLVILLSLLTGRSGDEEASPWLSTFSAEPSGFKAFYMMLSDLGVPVSHLKTEISLSKEDAQSMWILNPFAVPEKERPKLKEWVEQGNTIILTSWKIPFFTDDQDKSSPIGASWEAPDREFTPEGKKNFTRQVGKVFCFDAPLAHEALSKTNITLLARETPLILEKSVGKGRLVYLLQPQMFNNRNISRADNAVLAYNLAYYHAQGGKVYFDEGIRSHSSTWHVLFSPPFLWVSLQIILVVALFVYASSRRFGPVRPLPIAPRRAKDEYIYAFANLLMKKKNHRAILEIVKSDFLRWLNRIIGLPKSISEEQIADELYRRYQIPQDTLKDIFKHTKTSKSLSEKEWLETINKIEKVMSQCTSRRSPG